MDGKFLLLVASASMTAFAGTWLIAQPKSAQHHAVEYLAQDKAGRPLKIETCEQAKAAGIAPMYAGRPGYREELDADGTGVACTY